MVLLLVIYIAITVLGTIGNVLAIIGFWRIRSRCGFSPTSCYFILSLAICDLIICSCVLPMNFLPIMSDAISDMTSPNIHFCRFRSLLLSSLVPFSTLLMAVIAVDRYLFLCRPADNFMTRRRALIVLAILVALALVFGSLTATNVEIFKDGDEETSEEQEQPEQEEEEAEITVAFLTEATFPPPTAAGYLPTIEPTDYEEGDGEESTQSYFCRNKQSAKARLFFNIVRYTQLSVIWACVFFATTLYSVVYASVLRRRQAVWRSKRGLSSHGATQSTTFWRRDASHLTLASTCSSHVKSTTVRSLSTVGPTASTASFKQSLMGKVSSALSGRKNSGFHLSPMDAARSPYHANSNSNNNQLQVGHVASSASRSLLRTSPSGISGASFVSARSNRSSMASRIHMFAASTTTPMGSAMLAPNCRMALHASPSRGSCISRQSNFIERRVVRSSQMSEPTDSPANQASTWQATYVLRKNFKAAIMLFTVTIVFILFYLPATLIILELLPGEREIHHILYSLHFGSSATNPFIYVFLNSTIRKEMKKLAQVIFCGTFEKLQQICKPDDRLALARQRSNASRQSSVNIGATVRQSSNRLSHQPLMLTLTPASGGSGESSKANGSIGNASPSHSKPATPTVEKKTIVLDTIHLKDKDKKLSILGRRKSNQTLSTTSFNSNTNNRPVQIMISLTNDCDTASRSRAKSHPWGRSGSGEEDLFVASTPTGPTNDGTSAGTDSGRDSLPAHGNGRDSDTPKLLLSPATGDSTEILTENLDGCVKSGVRVPLLQRKPSSESHGSRSSIGITPDADRVSVHSAEERDYFPPDGVIAQPPVPPTNCRKLQHRFTFESSTDSADVETTEISVDELFDSETEETET